jgi:hypothetical protein
MIDVQLYIDKSSDDNQEYAKVDLFEDESMTLISSIQDIKDFSKIFADYSRTFKIPANDRNNKLFKHFYNPDVKGFNGATKKLAKIHLNYMPFREGYIYLQSTEMKNNKAASYTIIFYGGLIRLREALKEDKLTALVDSLDSNIRDFTYDADTVKTGFTNGLHSDAIIYPLITSEKRLYYDSSSASPNYDGNLYSGSTDATRGLKYTDLKPAIKVTKVLEAIESKYGISFTGFFDTTPLDNLYLWLSRKNGEIINYNLSKELGSSKKIFDLVTSGSNDNLSIVNDTFTFTQESILSGNTTIRRFGSRLIVTVTAGTYDYLILRCIDDITGDVISEKTISGVHQSLSLDSNPNYQLSNEKTVEGRTYKLRWEVETLGGAITFSAQVGLFTFVPNGTVETLTYYAFGALNATDSTSPEQDLVNHFPDMKVTDFLSGLFKMFNLTAYVKEPLDAVPVIEVQTLDEYYADAVNNMTGGTIDVVDFVDVESHEIEVARPFSSVSFEYEETNTILMENHETKYNKVFGNTTYNSPRHYNDLGAEYRVEIPFSHIKYERLFDIGEAATSENSNLTYIQCGYAAGGEFSHEDATTEKTTPTGNYKPENIKPLLFYGINQTITGGKNINWISGTESALTTYWRPSNSNEEGTPTTPPANSLNFDTEFDEWQLKIYRETDSSTLIATENSLFSKYYINYISGAYNESKRIFRYKCFLPAKILVRYKLNDQIKIHDRLFRINSIKTNLKTGATEIELLNLIPTLDNII